MCGGRGDLPTSARATTCAGDASLVPVGGIAPWAGVIPPAIHKNAWDPGERFRPGARARPWRRGLLLFRNQEMVQHLAVRPDAVERLMVGVAHTSDIAPDCLICACPELDERSSRRQQIEGSCATPSSETRGFQGIS